MDDTLLHVGVFGIIAVVVVVGFIVQKKRIEELRAAFADDPDVEIAQGWIFRMNTRAPHRPGHIGQAGGGKNNPPRWDIVSEAKELSSRTTLSLSREGALGSLREMFGMKDVHVGDADFDKAFTVRGSDSDAVRGIVSNPPVMDAVRALFALDVWSFEVKKNGAVSVRAPRSNLSGDHAKALLLATVQLANVLDDNASQPAVPARVA